jgi:segregation and condensation protein B
MLPVINQLHIQRSKKKLSQSALETLAIIAYQQPITKLEI